ncbi:MAG: hypothetical protein ACPGTU_13865, partial [Myxococcota bacterium]
MKDSCCEISNSLGESIAGTAIVNTTRWLMLEVPGSWAPKAIESTSIQGAVRTHIERALEMIPGS